MHVISDTIINLCTYFYLHQPMKSNTRLTANGKRQAITHQGSWMSLALQRDHRR